MDKFWMHTGAFPGQPLPTTLNKYNPFPHSSRCQLFVFVLTNVTGSDHEEVSTYIDPFFVCFCVVVCQYFIFFSIFQGGLSHSRGVGLLCVFYYLSDYYLYLFIDAYMYHINKQVFFLHVSFLTQSDIIILFHILFKFIPHPFHQQLLHVQLMAPFT